MVRWDHKTTPLDMFWRRGRMRTIPRTASLLWSMFIDSVLRSSNIINIIKVLLICSNNLNINNLKRMNVIEHLKKYLSLIFCLWETGDRLLHRLYWENLQKCRVFKNMQKKCTSQFIIMTKTAQDSNQSNSESNKTRKEQEPIIRSNLATYSW